MERSVGSTYLQWAKTRKPATFDLATSEVAPCTASDLGPFLDNIEINGPGLYGFLPLIEAIANHRQVQAECVVSTSGTSMANYLVMAALVEPGDDVLIEEPVYEPLIASARYHRASIQRFDRSATGETNLSTEMFTSRSKLVVLTNLHNPSCTELKESEIQRIAELARRVGARVLVDEVYLECKYERAASAFYKEGPFVCTGSLTKAYGLGGLRCGWIFAEPDLARRIWAIKDLVDPGSTHAGEILGVIAFQNLSRLAARAKSIVDTNRTRLAEFLSSNLAVELSIPQYGTCVFPRLIRGNSDSLFDRLHHQFDTDIVPGRFFERPDHFRLGIGASPEIFSEGVMRLCAALREQ